MRILILGSGGREHALAWKIKQSPLTQKLFCAPGNAGIAQIATCVSLATIDTVIAFCRKEAIEFVVVGPEQPLVDGWADALRAAGITTFGPSAKAAQLEGSKGFTKDICAKYNIPTAAYQRCHSLDEALAYLAAHPAPIVVKADGLAAGKGVTVAMSDDEAKHAVEACFSGSFGAAGASVVIEEYMEGPEVSFFALSDGERAIEFAYAQDHKRVGEGDTGPNTGGMGTYSTPALLTTAERERVMRTIITPTVNAMRTEGMPFQGVLFAGLMMTQDGPKLIEYNARFGDPETQVMLLRLESDLVPVLLAAAKGNLSSATLQFTPEAALCVVMASNGYPGDYTKHTVIEGLSEAAARGTIFHAGTAEKEGKIMAIGGRVLNVCARGADVKAAQKAAYHAVDAIRWPEGFCRRDIGWRAV